MPTTNLYFIGLIPPEEIRQKVRRMKEEIRNRFGAMHALKSPAHITLQKTFRKSEDEEPFVLETLKNFAARQKPFNITCSGFGCFARSVIYVNVTTPESIRDIHLKLRKVLADELRFDPAGLKNNLHPHMTIATRDLKPSIFEKAWPEFQKRTCDAEFEARNMSLLKHNGQFWEVYRDFSFDGVEPKLLANPAVGAGAY